MRLGKRVASVLPQMRTDCGKSVLILLKHNFGAVRNKFGVGELSCRTVATMVPPTKIEDPTSE